MDEKRFSAAKKLLDAAHEFWSACQEEGQFGAVQWLEDASGAMVVFTRGEYRHALLNNIYMVGQSEDAHLFGERSDIQGLSEDEK